MHKMLIAAAIVSFASFAAAAPDHVTLPAEQSIVEGERLHDVDHPWPFEPHYVDRSQWEHRAAALREQVQVAEGLWPMPERTPLNAVLHGKIERQGYTIEKVFFASMPGHYVSGNLYRPTGKSGKLPAVLSPHGHWKDGRLYEAPEAEARKQIASGGEQTMNAARYPLQARCATLARMGCVVFHYDMIGYADSQALVHRQGFTDVEATLRLQSFMGLQTWNSIRALDFLSGLDEVDPKRIAVTGASGGGTQTLILCAIDPRPAVSFPAVMVSEAMQGGCICENAPLARLRTNNAEIAALFAPKPMGMTAANDWTVDILTRGFPQIWSVYKLYDAEKDVAAWHRPFPHNYNQVSRELMYNWLNMHLKLGLPSPVKEEPFEPVPPKELSVYDAEHPRQADEEDATGLRKQMTAASQRPMTVETLRRGWGAIVADHLPDAHDIAVVDGSGPRREGGVTREMATIRRLDRSAQTPFVALTPDEWDGSVVVWVHPVGPSSAIDAEGRPTPAVRKLLDQHAAVLAIGAPPAPHAPLQAAYAGYTYPGYYFGYNAARLAERTSDVLNALALARNRAGGKPVDLIAFRKSGTAALLADALADGAVRAASIDLDGFDFEQVHEAADERMLPGALKYGGVYGAISLCRGGRTTLWNVPANGHPDPAPTPLERIELHVLKGNADANRADEQAIIEQILSARK